MAAPAPLIRSAVLGWFTGTEVIYGIEIPKLLSLLSNHNPNAVVLGLDAVPPENWPPVNVVRYSFQTMVGIGVFLALVGVVFLYVRVRRHRLPRSRWFYRAVVVAGPLISGWITTEVGRLPWVVYGFMRTSEAVTAASGIPVGYGTLAAVYVGVIVAVVWILRRLARMPLELPEAPEDRGVRRAAAPTVTQEKMRTSSSCCRCCSC